MVAITADFRKYHGIEDSIADHSAYLLGAKNGSNLRYDGLKGCTDYKKAVKIIKDGGYATSLIILVNDFACRQRRLLNVISLNSTILERQLITFSSIIWMV